MSQRPDDMLPEQLRSDLHGLVPSLPGEWDQRNADLMAAAHRRIGRSPLWVRAARHLSAAAALLIVAGITWQVLRPEPPATLTVTQQPTIVDALRLARQGASQDQIDRIAFAAVQLPREALQ